MWGKKDKIKINCDDEGPPMMSNPQIKRSNRGDGLMLLVASFLAHRGVTDAHPIRGASSIKQNGLANCLKSGNRGTVVAFHGYFRGRSVPVVLALQAMMCSG